MVADQSHNLRETIGTLFPPAQASLSFMRSPQRLTVYNLRSELAWDTTAVSTDTRVAVYTLTTLKNS